MIADIKHDHAMKFSGVLLLGRASSATVEINKGVARIALHS